MSNSLKLERQYNVPVERLYQAWTQPELVVRWMGPGNISCKNVEADLKVGGKYRIHMVSDECDHHVVIGEYKEIVPNQKLQYTWSWEGSEMGDTLVTVTFTGKGKQSSLILLHEEFPNAEVAEKHGQGWKGSLANLEEFLNR